MSNDAYPTPRDCLPAVLPGATLTPTGLELPEGLAYDDWLEGARVLSMWIEANELERRQLLWWWADLMRFGESHYGERSAQAMELGVKTGTAYNIAWIGSVNFHARREDLPFWTHAAVAMLDDPAEQKAWLDQAADEGWTRRELESAVKARTAPLRPEVEPDPAEAVARALRATVDNLLALEDLDLAAECVAEALLRPLVDRLDGAGRAAFLDALDTALWRLEPEDDITADNGPPARVPTPTTENQAQSPLPRGPLEPLRPRSGLLLWWGADEERDLVGRIRDGIVHYEQRRGHGPTQVKVNPDDLVAYDPKLLEVDSVKVIADPPTQPDQMLFECAEKETMNE